MNFNKLPVTIFSSLLTGSLASLCLLLLPETAGAQISLTAASNQYQQDFNSLISSGGSALYTDNSTLPGLYALIGAGSPGTGGSVPARIFIESPNDPVPGLGSMGNGNLPNRALGMWINNTITASNNGFGTFGFRFVNADPVQSITSITVQYTGQQWLVNSAADQTLAFSYAVFDAGTGAIDTPVGYSEESALHFISKGKATSSSGFPLYQQTLSATIAVTVLPGQELNIRWMDINDPGPDHMTAIDNLSVGASFDPVPAPDGLISALTGCGVLGLPMGLAHIRRRGRAGKQKKNGRVN